MDEGQKTPAVLGSRAESELTEQREGREHSEVMARRGETSRLELGRLIKLMIAGHKPV